MLTPSGDRLLLKVKVVPNSSRTQIAGILGDALKIKVAQPPEDNRANQAVIALLAETLQVAPSLITLVAGRTRAQKTFELQGITLEAARVRLTSTPPT